MDPMNTPDHSDALPVISSGCNRLRSARAPCSAPLLSSKHTELLRALTAYSSASMSTGRPRGHHDHSQRLEVALVYYRRRGVKALPSGLQRPSASVTAVCWWRLAGSTAPYDGSHTERHLRYRETLFQLSWRDQPSQWFVRMAQAVFHSTGSAGASRPGQLAHTPSVRTTRANTESLVSWRQKPPQS